MGSLETSMLPAVLLERVVMEVMEETSALEGAADVVGVVVEIVVGSLGEVMVVDFSEEEMGEVEVVEVVAAGVEVVEVAVVVEGDSKSFGILFAFMSFFWSLTEKQQQSEAK